MAVNLAGLFRQYAQAAIRAGVREGLTATAIRDRMTEEVGRAYRWQNLLADVRAHRLEFEKSQALAALDPNARITRDHITDAPPRGGLDFEYRVHLTGTDRRTGESVSRYLSIASDRLETKAWALDEALAAIGAEGYYAGQVQVEELGLDAVYSEE